MKTKRFFQACIVLCLLIVQAGFAQWAPVDGPAQDVLYLSATGSDIFAQTNTGFFYSMDNGLDWSVANSDFAANLVTHFLPIVLTLSCPILRTKYLLCRAA